MKGNMEMMIGLNMKTPPQISINLPYFLPMLLALMVLLKRFCFNACTCILAAACKFFLNLNTKQYLLLYLHMPVGNFIDSKIYKMMMQYKPYDVCSMCCNAA
jgi:hypothetical protein